MRLNRAVVAILIISSLALGTATADESDSTGDDSRQSRLEVSARVLFCKPSVTENFIAGETIGLGISITGVEYDSEGHVDALLRAEVTNAAGKTIVPVANERIHQKLALGGQEVSYGRTIALPSNSSGDHQIRVTVHDQISGKQATDKIDVVIADPSTFGLINVRTALDKNGTLLSDVIPLGRTLFVLLAANGYAIEDGKPNVEIAATIADLAGNQLSPEKVQVNLNAEEAIYGSANQANVGLYFSSLNRSGYFLLEIRAKDVISGKEVTRTIPIVVASGMAASRTQATAAGPQPNKR